MYRCAVFSARVCIFIITLSLASQQAFAQSSKRELRVFPNQYVIEESSSQGLSTLSTDQKIRRAGAETIRPLGANAKLVKRAGVMATASVAGTDSIPLQANDTFCADLIKSGAAKFCSPNFEIKIEATPNDPKLGDLWGMSSTYGIDAPSAWDVSTGTIEVVVAVIDTGIDYNHPDLSANVWTNPNEIPNNGIDDDSDGYIDDLHGINAITGLGDPMDDNGHGSHVSGTIGGRGNNAVGVVGVNWHTKIMGLKFLDANGSGSLSAAIEAINYMVAMKNRGVNIRVANNSWGGGGFSQALFNAIGRARDAGIIFVAAAGNESNDNDANPSYPADYDLANVVSVAAVDKNHNLASFSNYGANSVDIAAPGVDILSTTPGNTYQSFSGTSMATPHVTGALALLLGSEPNLSVHDAIQRVLESGVTLSTLDGGVRTQRMLNVGRMLHNITSPLPSSPQLPPACEYAVEDIAYSPDNAADGVPVTLQADENSFSTVALPFIFPFENQQFSSLYLSPNGVVYLQKLPSGMDFQNSESAPINAIAALQTDLVADSAPYGVRVASDADHITIYWLAKHYSVKSSGDIQVHLTLYKDGRIDDFVSFGDSNVETVVQSRGTIGLNGSGAGAATTYAFNSPLIKDRLAIRFTPSCAAAPGESAEVTSIRIAATRGTQLKKSVKSGEQLSIDLMGKGSGAVNLFASFNGRLCPSGRSVTLSEGNASFVGALPLLPRQINSLGITSVNAKASIKISHRAKTAKHLRRINASMLARACQKMYALFE